MTNLQEGKKGKERIKKEGRKEERKGRRDRGRKSLPCKIMQYEKIEIYIIYTIIYVYIYILYIHNYLA